MLLKRPVNVTTCSSIINDAAMFVSILDDSEDGEASAEIDVKETDNEVIRNLTGASITEFVGGCVSSEELFSSATILQTILS